MSNCSYPNCQFRFESSDLILLDGKNWCICHLPINLADDKVSSKNLLEFNAAIRDQTNLEGVIFPPDYSVHFNRTKNISFAKAVFHGEVNFSNKTFVGEACNFSHARFLGNADFRSTKFLLETAAHFSNVTFEKGADFTGATFQCRADFSNETSFFDHADFIDVHFHKGINFSNAIFAKGAHFDIEGANSNETIITSASFRKATFHKYAVFQNREFRGYANFGDCIFHSAPDFRGCILHEDTQFPEIVGFKDIESNEAEACYQNLRRKMGEAKSHKVEAMFYALEERSRRKQKNIGKLDRFISSAYDFCSEYGQSFVRPFVILIITLLLFTVVYSLAASKVVNPTLPFDSDLINHSFLFSLEQVVKPFSVFGGRLSTSSSSILDNAPSWIRYAALLQSLIGITLIALTILGLRWRFRRA